MNRLVFTLRELQPWFAWAPPWVFTLVLMLLALAAALIAHALLVRLLGRSLRNGHQFWRPLLIRSQGPGRLALVVAFLSAALAASPLTREQTALAQHAFAIA